MVNKAALKRPAAGLGVVTTSALCLLMLPLIYVAFSANSSLVEQWNDNLLKWRTKLYSRKEDDEPLKSLLSRLVREEDRPELESTGFIYQSELHTDICLSSNTVRVTNNGLTVHIPSNGASLNQTLRPYARKDDETLMQYITPVRVLRGKREIDTPPCDSTHNVPAVIFSSGVTGNIFHEFNEILIPLFLTTRHFRSRVQFVVTDYRPWWVDKYKKILTRLSGYEVMSSTHGVNCFPGLILGLKYHDNLALNPNENPTGHSVSEFRQFLRETYDLTVEKVREVQKPVVVLMARHKTRRILNRSALTRLMEDLGFQVIVPDPKSMWNMERFAKVLNSCSVMVGVHGAGFTNELFLPDGAVVIQIVGLGLEWPSNTYYGDPGKAMGLRYLEYKIEAKESSLYKTYGPDHPVISDPMSIFKKGYRAVRAVYLDEQNVEIDLARFGKTLLEAKRLVMVPH